MVRGPDSRELEPNPVLAVQVRCRLGDGVGIGFGELFDENGEETAEDRRSGDVEQSSAAAVGVPFVDASGRAAVHPVGGPAGRFAVRVDEPGSVALARQADSENGGVAELCRDGGQACYDGVPQERHVLLSLPATAVVNRDGFVVDCPDLAREIEGDGLDGRGPTVHSDDDFIHISLLIETIGGRSMRDRRPIRLCRAFHANFL